MIENLKKKDYIRKLSQVYLLVFSIIQLCKLTNILNVAYTNVIMFICGVIIFVLSTVTGDKKNSYPSILIIFCIVVILSSMFNLSIAKIKNSLFEIFYILIIYNISKEYMTEKAYIKLLKNILVLTFFITLLFYINYINMYIKDGMISKSSIVHIIFNNINGGALIALINIIVIKYMYEIRKINLPVAIILSVYYIIFCFISQSRTAILTLFILFFIKLYNCLIKKRINNELRKRLKKIIIMFIILVIIIMTYVLLKTNYNMQNKIDLQIYQFEEKIAKISSSRYWLWKDAIIELVDTNFVFGIKSNFGEESFKNINRNIEMTLSDGQRDILRGNNLHNGFVQILVENGLFGFVIIVSYFYIFGVKIYNLSSKQPYNEYIKFLYLFYIIINLFENNILLSNSIFVLFLWIQIGKDSTLFIKNKKIEGIDKE